MDEAFGERLGGKVECIGLHGDYSAGLQYIREGKLASLRDIYGPSSLDQTHTTERISRSQAATGVGSRQSPSPSSERSVTSEDASAYSKTGTDSPPSLEADGNNPSPPFSPAMTHLATPQFGATSIPPLVVGESDTESLSGSVGSYSQRGLHFKLNPDTDIPSSIAESTEDDTFASAVQEDSASNGVNGSKVTRPLHMVFLGSSLGNFARPAAAPFLASLPLKPGDTLLLGLDGRPHPGKEGSEKVRVAYNDPAGHTRAFEEHGWEIVRRELGLEGDAGVEFVGRYNEVLGKCSILSTSLVGSLVGKFREIGRTMLMLRTS